MVHRGVVPQRLESHWDILPRRRLCSSTGDGPLHLGKGLGAIAPEGQFHKDSGVLRTSQGPLPPSGEARVGGDGLGPTSTSCLEAHGPRPIGRSTFASSPRSAPRKGLPPSREAKGSHEVNVSHHAKQGPLMYKFLVVLTVLLMIVFSKFSLNCVPT
jgi:hypothetical protein